MRPCFVGADLGTSGIKAGVVDADGRVLASLYWDTELVSVGPGRMAQDPEEFCAQTLRIIREALARSGVDAGQVAGIALDGQMGGVIGVDRDFNCLTGLDMGLDIRSEQYNARMHREHGGPLRSLSCGSPRNTPKILWWKHEQGATYRKVAKFVTLGGFVSGKLTGLRGEEAFIDQTTLAFFGNEDARRRRWSPELSGALGLELDKFPRILQPWEVVGRLTREAAMECGLAQGTPVVAGAGDQPAGLLGAGFLHPGDLCDVSGSSTLLIQCVDSFRPDARRGAVAYKPSVLEDRYHALSYINGGGIVLNWLRDTMLGRSEHGFAELTQRASSLSPGAGGLLFLPYFGGRQCPYDAGFRGGWLGLNWGHRPEHLFRSLLEGLAYDSALGHKHLRELFPEIAAAELNSYGGGSRNALWAQIKANVLGLPVRCLESYHFAILGCALLAARGVGALQDLESAARRTPPECSAVFQPAPGPAGQYREYLDIFESCFFASDQAIPSVLRRLSHLAGE